MAGASVKTVSLSEIKSKLLRPALTSHYICDFQPPETGFIQSRVNAQNANKRYDNLSLACAEASLPGSSLMINDINDDRTGVTERHAYRRQYDDRADFTFYVDATEYYVIKLFEAWIGYAVNEQYGKDPGNLTYNYRVNFPDDYSTGAKNGGSLSITKFERDYNLTGTSLVYNFVKAFPMSINSIPVSYDSSELLKCTVSFTYSRYWIKQLSGSNFNPTGNSILNPEQIAESYTFTPNLNQNIAPNQFNRSATGPNDFLNNGNRGLDQFGVRDALGRGARGTISFLSPAIEIR